MNYFMMVKIYLITAGTQKQENRGKANLCEKAYFK
jgi:hypothetical protein